MISEPDWPPNLPHPPTKPKTSNKTKSKEPAPTIPTLMMITNPKPTLYSQWANTKKLQMMASHKSATANPWSNWHRLARKPTKFTSSRLWICSRILKTTQSRSPCTRFWSDSESAESKMSRNRLWPRQTTSRKANFDSSLIPFRSIYLLLSTLRREK